MLYPSIFVAPSTTPTILYRFEKYVNQSSSVFFSFSSRSAHSGRTSSTLVLVRARAREASLPVNTEGGIRVRLGLVDEKRTRIWRKKRGGCTMVGAAWSIRCFACYVEDFALQEHHLEMFICAGKIAGMGWGVYFYRYVYKVTLNA